MEHCNTTPLAQIDEHLMVLCIITLSPHSLAHITTDSNRTVISCKLAMHLWDAAFNFHHNYPLYMRSPPVHAMLSMLKNVVITCWSQFEYLFALQVNQDALTPSLDIESIQVDQVDKVPQAIAIIDIAEKLDLQGLWFQAH